MLIELLDLNSERFRSLDYDLIYNIINISDVVDQCLTTETFRRLD